MLQSRSEAWLCPHYFYPSRAGMELVDALIPARKGTVPQGGQHGRNSQCRRARPNRRSAPLRMSVDHRIVAENNPARGPYESAGFVLVEKHGLTCVMVRHAVRISRATRWMIGAHNRDEHRRKRHVPVSAPGTVAEVSVGETSRRSAIARVERRYPALDSRAYERARSRSRQPWWRRIRLIVGKVVAGVPTVPALRTSPPLTLGRLVTPDTAHAFVVARERYREGHRKCI